VCGGGGSCVEGWCEREGGQFLVNSTSLVRPNYQQLSIQYRGTVSSVNKDC